jgi:hypothetical protein
LIKRVRNISLSEINFRLKEEISFLTERLGAVPADELTGTGKSTMPEVMIDSLERIGDTAGLWKELFPESVRSTVAVADGITKNRIPIFSDALEFGGEIDWQRDYRSGAELPLKFYRDLHRAGYSGDYDPKNVWELNRHNYLLILGMAYLATRDTKYYRKWKEILCSWIEHNPYNRGINWESSIELAIRAINWIWSSYCFYNELESDIELQEVIARSLYLHAVHIDHHLSRYFSPNTHLTVEALGLLYIGMAYPSMKQSKAWIETGREVLDKELFKQVLDDGGYFERATYYHKYTIDLYLHYLLLGGFAGEAGRNARNRIEKMVMHLALLSEPGGAIPLLGDSDGGSLLCLSHDKRDIRGACCAASVLLENGILKTLSGDKFHEESVWLLGRDGYRSFQALEGEDPGDYNSIHHETGWYCFRSGLDRRDSFIIIDCGPHGWGNCGHAHADLLSFEWYCEGSKVILDPGTYSYYSSKESRDRDRSSQYHNTITMNGLSQSIPGDTFKWRRVAHPTSIFTRTESNLGYFEGAHDAYSSGGCDHSRSVIFFGRELTVIVDRIAIARRQSSLLYHLQFNVGDLDIIGSDVYRFNGKDALGEVYLKWLSTADVIAGIKEGEFYPDYNVVERAPALELSVNDLSRDLLIVTLLGSSRDLMESIRSDGCNHISGRSGLSEYSILLDRNEVSLCVGSGDRVSIMMRNSDTARNAEGDICFKSDAVHDFLYASAEGGVLSVTCENPPSSIISPVGIEEIFLNQRKIAFERDGDELIIRHVD